MHSIECPASSSYSVVTMLQFNFTVFTLWLKHWHWCGDWYSLNTCWLCYSFRDRKLDLKCKQKTYVAFKCQSRSSTMQVNGSTWTFHSDCRILYLTSFKTPPSWRNHVTIYTYTRSCIASDICNKIFPFPRKIISLQSSYYCSTWLSSKFDLCWFALLFFIFCYPLSTIIFLFKIHWPLISLCIPLPLE